MDLIEDIDDPMLPITRSCAVLAISRATLYRNTQPAKPPRVREQAPSPRRLSDEERATMLAGLHSPEFVDQPPAEVYATLLSRGVYHGSIRTMYRVLAASGETKERRNQRAPRAYSKPSLLATAPNQVWTWDITKLATTAVGVFLHAYVIIDLFSRYVVGWLVADKECKHLAAQLFADTIARHGVEPGLTVHSDRGSSMKSDTLAQLFASLGVERSFSRSRISDDNPFSEAGFKTMKYQPDYPGRFPGLQHARGWLEPFFGWHNDAHHHAGLALFTPADVFFGRVHQVRLVRQAALDAAFAAHPERFPKGPPIAALPPSEVSINPLDSNTLSLGQDSAAAPSHGPNSDGAESGARAAQPASAPLTRSSTVAPSRPGRAPPPPEVLPSCN